MSEIPAHQEIAGIRLVLVHMLARLPQGDLAAIADGINQEGRQ